MKIIQLLLILLFTCNSYAETDNYSTSDLDQGDEVLDECMTPASDKELKVGILNLYPYQYKLPVKDQNNYSGMDLKIMKAISKKTGFRIKYHVSSNIKELLEMLKSGKQDFIIGASYSKNRAEYAYYSEPYRYELDSIFVSNKCNKILDFDNNSELLTQLRIQNFKIGITQDFVSGDPEVERFINDESNADIINRYDNATECFTALKANEIEAVLDDSFSGYHHVLVSNMEKKVTEFKLIGKNPIHIIFSKKTVSPLTVLKFNQEIKNFLLTDRYKILVKNYLYSSMMTQIMNSQWFWYCWIAGVLSFGLAGAAMAIKEKSSLLKAFLFSSLPAIPGTVIKDTLCSRGAEEFNISVNFIYLNLAVLFISILIARILFYFNKTDPEKNNIYMSHFWDNIKVISEALGTAVFLVIGVSAAILYRFNPLIISAPLFAFFLSYGGLIVRDLISKEKILSSINGTINAENTIFWSSILTIYIHYNSYELSIKYTEMVIAICISSAFVSRLLLHYLEIPNIKFKS